MKKSSNLISICVAILIPGTLALRKIAKLRRDTRPTEEENA
jgi:hypothetical protein